MQELKEYINIRYAKEATCCTPLSCGRALDLAEVGKGEVFVDLGSGRGNDVLKAARMVGTGGIAMGIDLTKEMLDLAESNRRKLKMENVKFIESAIESLPLKDSSVDVIISNCTINHSKDKEKVYNEIFRTLKPGGRAIISDVLADKKLPKSVVEDPQAWADCYGGAIPKDEYYHAISNAGFKSVEIMEESQPYEKGGVLVKSITLRIQKNLGEKL